MSHYNVLKKYNKFVNTFDNGIKYLNEGHFSNITSKAFIFQSGIVNSIWQSWSIFWRTYWLTEVRGGINIHNNRTMGYSPSLSEPEAVHFLYTGSQGGRKNHSEEKNWGSMQQLGTVARKMYQLDGKLIPTIPISIKAQTVLSAISLLGNSVDHLQLVRNCSIHLDDYNGKRISTILPHYSLSNYKYPTDLIFSRTIFDGKKAIISWQEELTALLTLI